MVISIITAKGRRIGGLFHKLCMLTTPSFPPNRSTPNYHRIMGCDSDHKKYIWQFEDILKGNTSVLK